MSNVVVTSGGLSQVISAGGSEFSGPFFPIKYFLLVYDPRIDENVHTVNEGLDTDVLEFSATSLSGDTNPIEGDGHIVYNVDGYTLSSLEHLIISGDETIGSTSISNSRYNDIARMNLYNGDPLLSIISGGNTMTYNGGGNWIKDSDNVLVTKTSGTDSFITDKDNYFIVDSFSPIGVTSGSGKLRGLFKCRIGNQIGDFKFNKIALFTASFDGGVELDVQPTLVAMAGLKSVVLKTINSTNISNVEIDIEVEFNVSGPFSDISYMTNDYWTNISPTSGGGLYYDGNVVIASSGSDYVPQAKLNVTSPDKSQLRLSNVYQEKYYDFDVDSNNRLNIITSGNENGDVYFDNEIIVENVVNSETLSADEAYIKNVHVTENLDVQVISGFTGIVKIENTVVSADNEVVGIGSSSDILGIYSHVDPGTTDTGYAFKSLADGTINDDVYGGQFEAKDGNITIGVKGIATKSLLAVAPTLFAGGLFVGTTDNSNMPDNSTMYGIWSYINDYGYPNSTINYYAARLGNGSDGGDVLIDNNLDIGSDVIVSGNLNVGNDVVISGNLNVNENIVLSGDLLDVNGVGVSGYDPLYISTNQVWLTKSYSLSGSDSNNIDTWKYREETQDGTAANDTGNRWGDRYLLLSDYDGLLGKTNSIIKKVVDFCFVKKDNYDNIYYSFTQNTTTISSYYKLFLVNEDSSYAYNTTANFTNPGTDVSGSIDMSTINTNDFCRFVLSMHCDNGADFSQGDYMVFQNIKIYQSK